MRRETDDFLVEYAMSHQHFKRVPDAWTLSIDHYVMANINFYH